LKRTGSFYLAIFFALLGLAGVLLSLTFHYWEALLLPLLLSSIILIVAIYEIIKELRRKPVSPDSKSSSPDARQKTPTALRPVYWLVGWILAFVAMSWIFGFLISIPLFACSYLKWRRRSWLVSIAFAVIALAVIYVVFEVALKTEVNRGLLFEG
jgi:hypothetical protein